MVPGAPTPLSPSTPTRTGRARRAAGLGLAATAGAVALAFGVPRLPGGPDVYAHLLWAWQAAHCLGEGALPLWLPDLNAGFGSPGIRLYSPLGPTTTGLLGLGLGEIGRGMRAALALVPLALWLAVRCRRGGRAGLEWLLLALSPIAAYSLLGRAAVSEFLALPLAYWLLDRAVAGRPVPTADGPALAALWLLHAPTAALVVGVAAAALLARRDRGLWTGALGAGVAAAGLTAWHWLPLAAELDLVAPRAALTGGIFATARNVLGAAHPHAPADNAWLAVVAVAWLGAALIARSWRPERLRTLLAAGCLLLASPLALPLWRVESPLAFLQFPWRFLLPATLLLAPALAATPSWPHRAAASVVALLPLLAAPFPAPVADPGLRADTPWEQAGAAVNAALGGSPFLVDVPEHRPPAFAHLAGAIERFGGRRVAVVPAGEGVVERWQPLRREVSVRAATPALVEFRLLDYPFWRVTVDGVEAARQRGAGVVAVVVPAGAHRVEARWLGNPLARVGQATALATAALLAAVVLLRRRARPVRSAREGAA